MVSEIDRSARNTTSSVEVSGDITTRQNGGQQNKPKLPKDQLIQHRGLAATTARIAPNTYLGLLEKISAQT